MLKSGKKWNRIRSLLASQCAGIPRQVNLRRKNYSASIISEREFKKSKETLNSKAKCQRCQGKGKLPNRAQPYTRVDEELFWSEGKFESHNGAAFTNVTLRIWQSIWVSEAARTIKTLKLKIFPLCKWQLVAKLFSLKKIQPKPGKADWEKTPEVLLSKCSLPTVVNRISCGFAKSGLHVDPDQLEIPALCTLKLFLAPPQVLVGQISNGWALNWPNNEVSCKLFTIGACQENNKPFHKKNGRCKIKRSGPTTS